MAIGIPVFFMAAAEVVWELLDPAARSEAMEFKLSEQTPGRTGAGRTLLAIVWMVGILAGIVLLGYPLAIPLLILLYLKLQGREGWVFSGVFVLAVWGIFYAVFDQLLHLTFPAGWSRNGSASPSCAWLGQMLDSGARYRTPAIDLR